MALSVSFSCYLLLVEDVKERWVTMAEIVFFHHARGLTDGVKAFAQTLRDAGNVVHTPDLFDGLTFESIDDGVRHIHSLGTKVFAERSEAAVSAFPSRVVYGGASFGVHAATTQILRHTGALGAFFLYEVPLPSWWGVEWPLNVPVQAHQAEFDPWRQPEVEAHFAETVPGSELYLYPASGHLFLDSDSADFDLGAAQLATQRILSFVAGLPNV